MGFLRIRLAVLHIMRSPWHYKFSRFFSPYSYNASNNTDLFSYASVPWTSGTPSKGPSIRLLELAPSRLQKSRLHGKLFWTSLHCPATVPFKALSYVWGTGGLTSTIYINGRRFKITDSLEQALRHLRHPSESLVLWIDQISINQQDNEEKSQQVAQMGKIYQTAEETLVWLGPAENNSDLFMRVWQQVGKDAEDWGMMDYYTPARSSVWPRIVNNIDPEDQETREFHAMCLRAIRSFTLEFLNAMTEWHKRPWFYRVWVIQEFSLTSKATLVCGYQNISAEQAFLARQVFDRCYWYMNQKVDTLEHATLGVVLHALMHDPAQPFFLIRELRKRFVAGLRPGPTLYWLLHMLYVDNKMQATEPCDLIWGVLGLAVDSERPGFKADFKRKGQVELIYTEVAKAMIENGDLDLIALSQLPKTFHQLPSWVPDWKADPKRSFAAPRDKFENQFAASKNLPLGLLPTTTVKILGLSGFTIDQIERIGNKWQIEDGHGIETSMEKLGLLTEVNSFCYLSNIKDHNIYASHARRAEAKWRAPIGDIQRSVDFVPSRAESSYVEAYNDCMLDLGFISTLGPNQPDYFKSLEREYEESVTRNLGGRYRVSMNGVKNKRPFLSELGYVGMGPVHMQPGDIVVVFKGARIPYIVRRVEGGKYSFVGECYCDGIMDGEGLESRQEDFYLV